MKLQTIAVFNQLVSSQKHGEPQDQSDDSPHHKKSQEDTIMQLLQSSLCHFQWSGCLEMALLFPVQTGTGSIIVGHHQL